MHNNCCMDTNNLDISWKTWLIYYYCVRFWDSWLIIIWKEELKKYNERAGATDMDIQTLEYQLKVVGENMKLIEISSENSLAREEKYLQQISVLSSKLQIVIRFWSKSNNMRTRTWRVSSFLRSWTRMSRTVLRWAQTHNTNLKNCPEDSVQWRYTHLKS